MMNMNLFLVGAEQHPVFSISEGSEILFQRAISRATAARLQAAGVRLTADLQLPDGSWEYQGADFGDVG